MHNAKSERYQLIGGSSLQVFFIDSEFLEWSGVFKNLWRIFYFAVDMLAAKFILYWSLKKLAIGIKNGHAVELIDDACALALDCKQDVS